MDRFSCQVDHPAHGPTVVVAAGDVDLATCDALSAVAARHLLPGRVLVVDCRGITFLDSKGLRALLGLRRRAGRIGARLVLAGPSAPVLRVLQVSGTAGCFDIQDRPDPGVPAADGIRHLSGRGGHDTAGRQVRHVRSRTG